jgi:adenosine deaminase
VSLTRERIAALPKVSLHDHLDGGLRPGTVIELADEVGWELPSRDPQALGDWFFEAASSGSLERYLETFAHTTAVMQTTEQLRRVAREYVVDLAADGVVYAETRWAPGQHLRAGLSLPDTVEAVADGLAEGMSLCRDAGTPIVVGQIVSMMRHLSPDTAIAELALRYADRGVVGVDLAGAEAGHPAGLFREAYDMIHRYGGHATVHAGEAAGVESIREAVEICGAERIGHGVRLVDDLDLSAATPRLGPLATLVRDRRIALEVCPTSNLQTGVCATLADHPIRHLVEAGLTVTVNCDNRLMSRTTQTDELCALVDTFGYGLADLRRFAVDAAEAAFAPAADREALIREVILPGYADR